MRELAWIYTALFMAATAILGWAVYRSTQIALEEQLDSRIRAETDDLLTIYKMDGMAGLSKEIERHEARAGITRVGFILTDNQGKRIAGRFPATTPKPGWSIPLFADDEEGDEKDRARAYTQVLSNGGRLAVVADLESVEEIGHTLLSQFLVAFGAMLAIGTGGGILLTMMLRRRLNGINQAASAIIGGNLSKRMPIDGSGGEFDQLSLTLNEMLDQIAALMDNLRQVSGDIAHDLRSPLTRLRQRLEGGLSDDLDSEQQQNAIEDAIGQADDLLAIFTAILGISEIEGGQIRSKFTRLRLDRIVADVGEAFQPAVEDAGFSLSCEIDPDCTISGDRHLLGQMLTNLLDNCLRHATGGSAIFVGLRKKGNKVELVVSDDGSGIPENRHADMLRRFARLETSRTTSGNGLGLSLVKAIADAHGARLTLSDNQPGLKVTISFKSRRAVNGSISHA
jgi:signal transduction histidine kinase